MLNRTTFIISSLLAAILLIGCSSGQSASNDVQDELARIKAEGAPVTLRDLDGTKLPDEKNGAIVYQKIFDLMESKGAKEDVEFTGKVLAKDKSQVTEAEWKMLATVAAKYDELMPLTEQAQSRPECRFPVGWEKNGAMGTTFPHCGQIRNLSRILHAKSVASAREGRLDEALRTVELNFGLGDALGYHATQIGVMVRAVTANTASAALRDVLEYGPPTEKQARRLSDTLANIDLSNAPAQALQVERAMGINVFADTRAKGPDYFGADHPVAKALKQAEAKGVLAEWIRDDERFFLQQTRDYIVTAGMTYREALASGRNLEESAVDYPKNAVISAICLPLPPKGLLQTRDRAQAEINGSRIALALAVHYSKQKSYPASLKEVSSFFNGKLPIDPFTGKDFIYKKHGTGYLLYSIGPNLKDDEGREPGPDQRVNDVGDVVWRTD